MKRTPLRRKSTLSRGSGLKRSGPVRRSADTRRSRAVRAQETGEIYRAVRARAAGHCEFCTIDLGRRDRTPELDHFWGRVKVAQSAESTWMLCRACHHEKTENRPTRVDWIRRFHLHVLRHGYAAEAIEAYRKLQWAQSKSC